MNDQMAFFQLLGLAERLRNWEGLVSVPVAALRVILLTLSYALKQPDPKTLFVGKIEAIKNEV